MLAQGRRAVVGSVGVMSNLQIEHVAPQSLRPYAGNARIHAKKQIKQIARSIERFGFTNPILVSNDREVIAGHGRLRAAQQLGLTSVPIVVLATMSEADRRASCLPTTSWRKMPAGIVTFWQLSCR